MTVVENLTVAKNKKVFKVQSLARKKNASQSSISTITVPSSSQSQHVSTQQMLSSEDITSISSISNHSNTQTQEPFTQEEQESNFLDIQDSIPTQDFIPTQDSVPLEDPVVDSNNLSQEESQDYYLPILPDSKKESFKTVINECTCTDSPPASQIESLKSPPEPIEITVTKKSKKSKHVSKSSLSSSIEQKNPTEKITTKTKRKFPTIELYSEELTMAQLCTPYFLAGESLPEKEKVKSAKMDQSNTVTNNPTGSTGTGVTAGPRVRIVNGQVVLDTDSLTITNTAKADIEYLDEEVVDDDDKIINYGSYMKKDKQQRWTNEETDFFYQGISQWGTDFEMITQMFQVKAAEDSEIRTFTRRQIKNKYRKEEKSNPLRLGRAMTSKSQVSKELVGKLIENIESSKKTVSEKTSIASPLQPEKVSNVESKQTLEQEKEESVEEEIIEEYAENELTTILTAEEIADALGND